MTDDVSDMAQTGIRTKTWLAGSGTMGDLIRSFDWSKTPIGPVDSWSPTLRTIVDFLLANRFPIMLWWGPEYISFYNDAYIPVLGRKHPWGLGRPVRECWSEAWDILKPLIDTPFRGGPATWSEDIEFQLNRAGFTEETHFTIAYSPVPDESAPGGVGGVLATVHEISQKVVGERRVHLLQDLGARAAEAKTAEEACSIAAGTLARYPKDVPFALLYLIDDEGKCARLAGATGMEMGGAASPLDIGLVEDLDAPWPLAAALREESLQVVENLPGKMAEAPPGPWPDPPESAVLMPIRSNMAHQLAGVLVMGISSRLQFDGAYRGFCELLASQVAAIVANARAYDEERKRAEALAEIDRAKTVFFSNVSHEFRTPLTLILGPIEDMLARAAPEQREDLELAHRNGLRMQKLVNTLLDFSRIEASRMQASYAPADLAALTEDLAGNFRSLTERAGLTLIVDCVPLPEPVYIDHEMWEKIVFNLLSNAFKFTLEGGISVGVKTEGKDAVLVVADTGVGISEAELPRIFERFHRIEGTRGRTYEGTGIGLALVRDLINLHGGSVEVESKLGEGSVFRVKIPLGSAHLPQDRVNAARTLSSTALSAAAYVEEAARWLPADGLSRVVSASMPKPAKTAQSGAITQPQRILVADDNADMREYIGRILSETYRVDLVANGGDALAAAVQSPPDLVLADIMMPGMDGFALLRVLRRGEATRSIPVILVSARAGEEARIEGLQRGADDYLTKPFSARELRARVEARLELDRMRKTADRAVRESEERLNLAAQAGKLGAWDLDLVSRRTTCTAQCKAHFGYPPDFDFTYERLFEAIHPGDRAVVSDAVERAVSARQDYEAEYRCLWPDRSLHWIAARGRVFFDGDRPVRMVGVTVDVTARKQAEDLQAEQAQLLELIASGRPSAECLTALTDSVERLNPASRAAVLLVDETCGRIDRVIAAHLPPSLAEGIRGVPINDLAIGTCATAIYNGETVVCADIANDERWSKPWRELCVAHGVLAGYSTPVFGADGKAVASFFLCFGNAHEPDEWEHRVAEFGAHIAGIVIEREWAAKELLRSQAQLEQELADTKLLQGLSTELIGEESIEILYEKIMDAAVAIMRSDCASMQMLVPERGSGGALRLIASRGFDPEAAAFWEWVDADSHSTCGVALRGSRRVVAPDVEKADFLTSTGDLAMYQKLGIHAAQTTPLLSRGGKVLGMISTHWREPHQPAERDFRLLDILARQAADLIERRLAGESLARRTAQFQALLNEAPLGVYLVDADFRIRQANPTAMAFFGNIPSLIGRDFDEVIHILWPKSYADEVVGIFRRTLETGEPYMTPERIERRLDRGLTEYYEWRVHRIPLPDGRNGVVCYFRDISAQVRARLAIAKSEERLRFTAESMPQKIFTATADGNVDYLNQQWMEFTGLSDERLKGPGWLHFVHPEDAPETIRSWKHSLEKGEPFQCVHRFRRADGAYRWHLSRAKFLGHREDRTSMWIGSNTEIHEQKQIEEELRRLNSDLNQFAFAASHDLQEPLRMVTSYAQLLLDNCGGDLNKEANLAVGYIKEGTMRMRALLADLLAYTQVAGRGEPSFAPIDFNGVMDDAAKNLETSIKENGADVTSDPLPVIPGERAHFVQLLQNLVGNAIKYRGGDAPRIHVSAERQNNNGWRFAVADNGIGIDPEYHKTIFGVFRRLHGRTIPGTGIGLAICQRVVERYGGKIWVDSQPGRGSTFYFTLPGAEGESQ